MENTNEKIKVYNLVILDKSGSMSTIADAAVDGFNQTLMSIRSAQKEYAETQQHYVSLLTFCSCERKYIYSNMPVGDVHRLRKRDFRPCCSTPLYDAMGLGINDLLSVTSKQSNAMVAVTIITDGYENDSREYTGASIKALVDRMRNDYGWNFAYIGANQDVEKVASSLAIEHSMSFEYSEDGMHEAWETERKARQRMFDRINFLSKVQPEASREDYVEMVKNQQYYFEKEQYANRVTPRHITHLRPNEVFVFGSNPLGYHNGGAAQLAVARFGAVNGQARGPQGQCYAIVSTESLKSMELEVMEFIYYAQSHSEQKFLVTAVGCGSGGKTISEVARLFSAAVDVPNISLPQDFWDELV